MWCVRGGLVMVDPQPFLQITITGRICICNLCKKWIPILTFLFLQKVKSTNIFATGRRGSLQCMAQGSPCGPLLKEWRPFTKRNIGDWTRYPVYDRLQTCNSSHPTASFQWSFWDLFAQPFWETMVVRELRIQPKTRYSYTKRKDPRAGLRNNTHIFSSGWITSRQ